MISIIVPAHNESQVITRCLTALTDASQPGELEIIVVCNGCTDDTAAVARRFAGPVTVIDSPVPSKVNALNLGDRAATAFPRFYVDADVIFSIDSIRQIAQWLGQARSLAAAPSIQLDLSHCTWPVKAFYEIDRRMPSHREGIGGSGVYALSETGRKRFEEFPSVTADDGFIRLSFTPAERATLPSAHSTVTPPRNLSGLIQIKTRSHFGNAQLCATHPQMINNRGPGNRSALKAMLFQPGQWLNLAVYLYVKSAARYFAHRRLKRGHHNKWERDDSSRKPAPSPVHA